MFNIKFEETSYKMSFKALPFKIQQSKNRQGRGEQNVPPLQQIGSRVIHERHLSLKDDDDEQSNFAAKLKN